MSGYELSQQTACEYMRIVSGLLKQYEKVNPYFDPMDFSRWFVEEKLKLAKASWKLYRAAVNFYIREQYPDYYDEVNAYLSEFSSGNKHTQKAREKSKSYTEQQLKSMLGRLGFLAVKGGGACHAEMAFLYVKCGDLVGLRPCEWVGAAVIAGDDGVFLRVKNAKRSNGRSHSDSRDIDIGAFSDDDRRDIEKLARYVNLVVDAGSRDSFMEHYNPVRGVILKANNFLFPGQKKTFALYTTRHQVVSYLKNDGCPPEQISAIIGHGAVVTQREHYGRKSKRGGRRLALPGAVDKDVKAVLRHPSNLGRSGSVGPGIGL